jgi:hypothetical protein
MTTLQKTGAAALLMSCLMMAGCNTTGSQERLPRAFNGTDLTGWKVPDPNPFWRVENGVLVGENDSTRKGSMLYTERDYYNFIFQAEVRWSGEIDSGVMFRRPELQLQTGVSRSLKRDMTGSFYTGGKELYPGRGQAKEIGKVLKEGDWNLLRIQAVGDTFTTWINGVQVSQFTDAKYNAPGPIGLQIHAGLPMKVEFRDIRIKSLEP